MLSTALDEAKIKKYDDSSEMASFAKYSGLDDSSSNKVAHQSRAPTQRDPRFLLHNPYIEHDNEKVGVGGGGSGMAYHDDE